MDSYVRRIDSVIAWNVNLSHIGVQNDIQSHIQQVLFFAAVFVWSTHLPL
eukprot:TRINITY_DN3367_c0_g1_i1.p2 TRINITY_DN3367_c0_g1~~TRINITY_DN3367_c0_g1_i1.p2  ORF type:complete len:50 (-),score=3.06 TRINITY_DN3367_c0_g1_i1:41-190(-)